MKKQADYWTYKAGDVPEISDLPAGTFAGTAQEWEQLSPGMRREILRQAERDAARRNYEADLAARPNYHDGTPRKTWDQLGELERSTWNAKK